MAFTLKIALSMQPIGKSLGLLLLALLLLGPLHTQAQTRPGASAPTPAQLLAHSGRELLAETPITQHFGLEDVRPELHRWYVPQHLQELWENPWYISDTYYAQEAYHRYLDAALEGELWYDVFGYPVERGWLLYEWSHEQVDPKGSSIWKSGQYKGLFQNLVIASESRGGNNFRLLLGDQIYSTFTPLTFDKPQFDGLRLDYAGSWCQASLILSRPSMPDEDAVQGAGLPSERTNFTNLMGGHAEFQLGGLSTLGLTYVDAHHGQTKQDFGVGSPFSGSLTTDQNIPLKTLWVRLRDDSPEDERGGALLFDYDIVLEDTTGRQLRGRQIGFLPQVEGGLARGSSLAADGSETILLTYDLTTLNYDGTQSADLTRASVELAVANDYRVEVASDRQNDGETRRAAPVFLVAYRAPGNVQDNSNATILRVDYGLPTATEVIGCNWNLPDWKGLSLQGEAALSRRHRYYPCPASEEHHHAVDQSPAAYLQAAYRRYPWGAFAEAFTMADGYSTTAWLSQSDGKVKYNDPTTALYEFVDDDDDYDGTPEWTRRLQGGNDVAWPGYDENRDFLHDYNENGNLYPDYEEPFLRFRSDRPEFLPGLDMNYNGTIDRFENDQLPDYPYKKDQRGFNLYGQVHATPDMDLLAGAQRVRLISGDGRTRAWYLLGRWTWDRSGQGRLRVFEYGALVQDDIPDPLRQWVQPPGTAGRMRDVPDLLPARNTYLHTLYADWDHHLGPGLHLQHRLRWDGRWQRDPDALLQARDARAFSGFFGLIDKAEWSLPVGLAVFEPRWKSEYRQERPFSRRLPAARSLEETAFLLWTQPLMAEHVGVSYFPRYGRQIFSTELQAGLELSWFRLLEGQYEEVDENFSRWTWITQLTNRSAYQGYQVVTRLGLELGRQHFARQPGQRHSLFFATVHAGLE